MKQGCDYCQKSKTFNSIYYGDVSVKCYISGNRLNTDVHDDVWPDEDDGKSVIITNCPFCGAEVHKLLIDEEEEN